jgi:anti-sigma28 factor (negative regulator of flagellin synthesis)
MPAPRHSLKKTTKRHAQSKNRGRRKAVRRGEKVQDGLPSEALLSQPGIPFTVMRDQSRAERVKKLQEQILQGTYRIDAKVVAKAILRRGISRLLDKRRT